MSEPDTTGNSSGKGNRYLFLIEKLLYPIKSIIDSRQTKLNFWSPGTGKKSKQLTKRFVPPNSLF